MYVLNKLIGSIIHNIENIVYRELYLTLVELY